MMSAGTAGLQLHVEVRIRPDAIEDFLACVTTLVATALAEPGVVSYQVGRLLGPPGGFLFLERYVDEPALAAHLATQACQDYVAALPGWLVEAATARIEHITPAQQLVIEATV